MNLFTEILIVPISIFIGLLYALGTREKKYFQVKRFFDWLFVILEVIIIINSCKHLYENPSELFNLSALQEFLLPTFLLLLNLPVVLEQDVLAHMKLTITCVVNCEEQFRKAMGAKQKAETKKEVEAKR